MNTISTLRIFFSGCFIVLAMASSSYAYEMRTWTAMNGKTVEAAYVKYEFPNVSLQRRDGQIIKVNRDQLSDDDWLYVSQYDSSILTFWVPIGEVQVHPVTLSSEGVNIYSSGGATGPWLTTRDSGWRTLKQIAGSPAKRLEVFVSSNNLILFLFNSEWSAVFPMPKDPSLLFSYGYVNNSIQIDKNRWREVERVISFWSDDPTKSHADALHVLILNGTDMGLVDGDIMQNSYSTQVQFNLKFKTNIRYFVLDKSAGEVFHSLSKEVFHAGQAISQSPRYARLQQKIEQRKKGIPDAETPPTTGTGTATVRGSGSGFFITNDGYFLTNYHVVQGGSTIRLVTETGSVNAKVVQLDYAVDLALLKVDSRTFQSIPFLGTDEVALGADIFTIGFPMPDLQGFSPKMTKGVISSMKGMHDDDKEYQIDAAIQPGNSGGPVVNNNGEVVGVVVASLREQYVAETKGILPQNVNYAIKKKHVIDFLSKVPNCFRGLKSSNLPASTSSASPATVDSVLKSCAMVIVYE